MFEILRIENSSWLNSGVSGLWILVIPKMGNKVDIKQKYSGVFVYL